MRYNTITTSTTTTTNKKYSMINLLKFSQFSMFPMNDLEFERSIGTTRSRSTKLKTKSIRTTNRIACLFILFNSILLFSPNKCFVNGKFTHHSDKYIPTEQILN